MDEDGQAAITDDGVVRRIREYDTTGEQMLLDSCFASKNSCGIKAFTNVYFAVFHFDDKGNLREERYTDANIQPVAGRLGYWRAKKTFYDNGQPSLAEAWAPPGKGGIFGNTNLNHYVLINDEAGNEVARFGFDAEGMPTDIFESPGYVVSFDQNGKSTGKFFIQQ